MSVLLSLLLTYEWVYLILSNIYIVTYACDFLDLSLCHKEADFLLVFPKTQIGIGFPCGAAGAVQALLGIGCRSAGAVQALMGRLPVRWCCAGLNG